VTLSLGNDFATIFQPRNIQSWPLLKDNDFFSSNATKVLKIIVLKENNRPHFLANTHKELIWVWLRNMQSIVLTCNRRKQFDSTKR